MARLQHLNLAGLPEPDARAALLAALAGAHASQPHTTQPLPWWWRCGRRPSDAGPPAPII
jgi:hypothetical protein